MTTINFVSVLITMLSISIALMTYEVSADIGSNPSARIGSSELIKNIKDPKIVELSKFAVSEYNKRSKNPLVYVDVVKGAAQMASGTKYKLLISAKDGATGETRNYGAIVWVKPWENFRQLEAFAPVSQPNV